MNLRLAPAAIAALGLFSTLAGRSDAAQIMPTIRPASAQPFGAHALRPFGAQQFGRTAPMPVPRQFLHANLGQPIPPAHAAIPRPQGGGFAKKAPLDYIFTSDNATGDVSVYDEATLTLQGQGSGLAGWGVAADKKGHICWGTLYGTITCGVSTSEYLYTQTSSLTETFGAAYGMAFTTNGDLYATNFGTDVVDHYTAAQVAGCASGCGPASIFAVQDVATPFFLGADGAKLYVDGYDSTGDTLIGTVNVHSGKYKGTLVATDFFPGGIAFDAKHDLTWNDQYGYLLTYAPPYQQYDNYLYYGNPSYQIDITAIALDASESTLLAARIFECGSGTFCSDAEELSYPLGAFGIASGLDGDVAEYGIAITPQAKN